MPGMPGKPCRDECVDKAMAAANKFTQSIAGMDPIYRRTAILTFTGLLSAATGGPFSEGVVNALKGPIQVTSAPTEGGSNKTLKRKRVKKTKPMKTIKRKPRRKSKRIHNIQ